MSKRHHGKHGKTSGPLFEPSEALGSKSSVYKLIWKFCGQNELDLPFEERRKLFDEVADKHSVLIKDFSNLYFLGEIVPEMNMITVSGQYSKIFDFFTEFRREHFAQLAAMECIERC